MGKQEKEDLDLKDLQDGPLTQANRECRDILCCLLFTGAILVMLWLTVFAYTTGKPHDAFRGVDQNGDICGVGAFSEFPYLYFTNPIHNFDLRVCVAICPSIVGGTLSTISCPYAGARCTYTVTYDSSGTTADSVTSTSVMGYDSSLAVDRVCIPSQVMFDTAFGNVTDTFSSAIQQKDLANIIEDIQNNWYWLLAGVGIAFIASFVMMFLLRCCAGCVIWCSLFGIIFFLIGLGCLFLYNSGKYFDAAAGTASYIGVPTFNDTEYNEIYGWIFIGLGCLFLIVVLCCCSRLRIAVAVCKSAGQFVGAVCTSILVPIIQAIIAIGMWAACLVVMVYLVSATKFSATTSDYYSKIDDYGDDALLKFYFFVFCTLWVNAFIQAMTIFIIASAASMWYYSHGPGAELNLPIGRSYKMVFRFHFGSLAFGSLILAIVQFMQLMVEVFKKQAGGDSGNKCVQYCTKCITCCLQCVQRIVQFINTTAYIQIAIRGKNFCYAAKDGFDLVWSNAMRYAIVSGVGTVLMFLGKILIASLAAFSFYCLITYVESIRKGYLQPMYSVIIVGIIALCVGTLFMSVYSIAMDTLLQCFIIDQSNNKGKKAVHAPPELAELMEKD